MAIEVVVYARDLRPLLGAIFDVYLPLDFQSRCLVQHASAFETTFIDENNVSLGKEWSKWQEMKKNYLEQR